MERREFLSAMTAFGSLAPIASQDVQRPEVRNIWAEVPPGSTLWALAVFLGDDLIEFTVSAGKDVQTLRGQYGAQRMKEYSWRNTTGTTKNVMVRARALAGIENCHRPKWNSSARIISTSPSADAAFRRRWQTATALTRSRRCSSDSSRSPERGGEPRPRSAPSLASLLGARHPSQPQDASDP